MADALQHVKYTRCAELDARDIKRRSQLTRIEDWNGRVLPHLSEADRLPELIAERARLFAHKRAQYADLSQIAQVPWHSRGQGFQ